jgi:hypothetical protein
VSAVLGLVVAVGSTMMRMAAVEVPLLPILVGGALVGLYGTLIVLLGSKSARMWIMVQRIKRGEVQAQGAPGPGLVPTAVRVLPTPVVQTPEPAAPTPPPAAPMAPAAVVAAGADDGLLSAALPLRSAAHRAAPVRGADRAASAETAVSAAASPAPDPARAIRPAATGIATFCPAVALQEGRKLGPMPFGGDPHSIATDPWERTPVIGLVIVKSPPLHMRWWYSPRTACKGDASVVTVVTGQGGTSRAQHEDASAGVMLCRACRNG